MIKDEILTSYAIIPSAEQIVIASDGAVCDEQGLLIGLASKVVLIPEWSAVFTNRGATGFARALYYHLGWHEDFDSALTNIEEASRFLHVEFQQHYKQPCHWSMVAVGWSRKRSQPEMYFLRSREFELPNLATGECETITPYTLTKFWGLHAAPMPDSNLLERFGINLSTIGDADPIELACRLVAASRFQPDIDFSESGGCIIGGFMQVTALSDGLVISKIVHRWADQIGAPINPYSGDPVPPFLQAQSARE